MVSFSVKLAATEYPALIKSTHYSLFTEHYCFQNAAPREQKLVNLFYSCVKNFLLKYILKGATNTGFAFQVNIYHTQ